MNAVFKLFLSMSFSGGLLALVLFCGKPFLRDRLSRQWQYYIWLAVILRLLLPFGPETSLLGKTYRDIDQAVTRSASSPQQLPRNTPEGGLSPAADPERTGETTGSPAEGPAAVSRPFSDWVSLLAGHAWLLWLTAALGLLIRKVTAYQSFIRYIRAGLVPVSDTGLLDRLSIAAERAGVQKPVELCVHPLVSSPLLIGFFHPCIVLPGGDIPETNFQYIVLHELTHYRRRDMFYKWLVQITVCLHWFNPLVHLMSRELAKACEFSCDEAVLAKTGYGSARDYGKTLLDAMAAAGTCRETLGAVTLSENKQLLKERLRAMMNFKKKSTARRLLTGALTLCIVSGAVFSGVYPASAASGQPAGKPAVSETKHSPQGEPGACSRDCAAQAERYYEAGSLPLFQIVFSRLDEEAQDQWLDRIYTDDQIMFWGAAAGLLDEDCGLEQFSEIAIRRGK